MKLGYVIVYVSDVSATLDFYQAAFRFKIRMKYEDNNRVDYGELETGDAILGFASYELGQANLNGQYQKASINTLPFGQELAFVTDDVPAAYQWALQAGAAYPPAIDALKKTEALPEETELRQIKYLNNLIEQDHRNIKRRVNPRVLAGVLLTLVTI